MIKVEFPPDVRQSRRSLAHSGDILKRFILPLESVVGSCIFLKSK